MTNIELQELLKQFPDDMPVIYFHPTRNIQTVSCVEEIKIGTEEKKVLSIEFGSLNYY